MNEATVTRRFRRLYDAASPQTQAAGRAWYDEARSVAENISDHYGITVEQAAYVIAVLSANITWRENIASAWHACEGHSKGRWHWTWKGAGYGRNKAKAQRILDGDLAALSGPKVTAFAKAILGDDTACTIDVWMARAAGGIVGNSPNRTEQKIISRALHRAAKAAGDNVRDFQAIVWLQVRGT